ncbi:alpha/beta hydrolase [Aquimarina spongiae]|uniref:Proline iminopeptidase n=1 Tax=Aquimarina spongiae TaxID=570521 RepID=A0A1M6CES9_9FLAO|nr:alpha/beta hydrolase [Aquimarina spongiae]SHI59530.1 proline iminopeptidase [Aquimarina spongiae]
MKKTLVLFCILLVASVRSQTLFTKAFGNPNHKAIIFLHGGPGYNAAGFERTTAQILAENGFYVIVYDRRGEGRSTDKNTKFTFEETFNDLNAIYDTFDLKTATLMGHSFGGIVATLYAEQHPNKIKSVVLVSTPLSMQETLSTIVKSSKEIYMRNKDTVNLNYIRMLEKIDKSSIQYSSYCFSHAMQNGFYHPQKPTTKASQMYANFKKDPVLLKYASQMTFEAPMGFWKNEKYTTLDIKDMVKNIQTQRISIFGIYGEDDGLFSEMQIEKIKNLIGNTNFKKFDHASHNPFIDCQKEFIDTLKEWIN